MLPHMCARPTKDLINAALERAANAARENTRHFDRVLKHPLASHSAEPRGERWWLIGWIRVLGESEEWEVLYDPVSGQGKLQAKQRGRP
jgi:hypothetical protein